MLTHSAQEGASGGSVNMCRAGFAHTLRARGREWSGHSWSYSEQEIVCLLERSVGHSWSYAEQWELLARGQCILFGPNIIV